MYFVSFLHLFFIDLDKLKSNLLLFLCHVPYRTIWLDEVLDVKNEETTMLY